MVVPPALGLWLDHTLGTQFVFVLIGAILGLCTGILSLLQLARSLDQPRGSRGKQDTPPMENDP
jgi:F0F1-type ATP synthase assembly protein I